jgi:hypothetical protein
MTKDIDELITALRIEINLAITDIKGQQKFTNDEHIDTIADIIYILKKVFSYKLIDNQIDAKHLSSLSLIEYYEYYLNVIIPRLIKNQHHEPRNKRPIP